MTLSERLLQRKAAFAREHFAEGGTVEDFPARWARIEAVELAELAGAPDPDRDNVPISEMGLQQKIELRGKIGDAAFAARIARENRNRNR